jgi:hypothetical protein
MTFVELENTILGDPQIWEEFHIYIEEKLLPTS